jgi:hypothetical protein
MRREGPRIVKHAPFGVGSTARKRHAIFSKVNEGILFALLCLASCGGGLAHSDSNDGGASQLDAKGSSGADAGRHSDGATAAGDTGAPNDSALPEVDSSACDMQLTDDGMFGLCIFCSDHNWHCDGPVYAQCPTDIKSEGSCDAGSECFNCPSTNAGIVYMCEPKGTWSTSPGVHCLPRP